MSGDANLGGFRSFRVQTTAGTAELLAEALGPFCGDDSVALPLATGLSVGTVTRFVVSLPSGQAVFRGRGQVMSVRAAGAHDGWGTARLKVLEVVDETRVFWGALLQRKRASSRMPPPPLPGRRSLPKGGVPPAEPAPELWASLIASVFYGEDNQTPELMPMAHGAPLGGLGSEDPTAIAPASDAALADSRDRTPLPTPPILAAPVRVAGQSMRLTGKTPGYTAKSMVARKSAWPPWAQLWGGKLQAASTAAWARVPPEVRPGISRFGPWVGFWALGLLCGLWWAPGKPAVKVAVAEPPALTSAAMLAPPQDVPPPASPRRGPDRCTANITTEPEGAQVFWGETALGETPLQEATVPCGRALVSLKRARYEPVLVTVTATMDGPVTFAQTLQRPQAELLIISEPSGAQVFLGDEQAGKTPVRLAVAQFQTTALRVQKDGFEAVTRQVRMEGKDKEIRVRLARPKARKRTKRR